MNRGTWGGEIIRTNQEVRDTPNSRVTDVFMKLPNEDNDGFAFMPVDAWGELADDIAELPVGSYLEFDGRINTRSYESNGKKVYVTSLVVQEIINVEIPEEKPKSNKGKSSTEKNSGKGTRSGNNGRSPGRSKGSR